MTRTTAIYHSEDRRDPKTGLWIKSWCESDASGKFEYVTSHYTFWNNMNSRCIAGGSAQTKYPTYSGAKNLFQDFQAFSDWASSQAGYLQKDEDGDRWHLDKDILSPLIKVYSSETCCFIPKKINVLLKSPRVRSTSSLPYGVSVDGARFKVRIKAGSKDLHLGSVGSPADGHRLWQEAKSKRIREVAREYEAHPASDARVLRAILSRADQLDLDIRLGIETKDFR